MSTAASVMLVLVGGFVWGGFVFLLIHAVRREGAKRRAAEADRRR